MEQPHNGSAHPPADAADQFVLLAKETLRPEMVREIPDELFHPSREAELKREIETVTDAWLVRDKIPIGRQLRIKLIESILADIARASGERFGKRMSRPFRDLGKSRRYFHREAMKVH